MTSRVVSSGATGSPSTTLRSPAHIPGSCSAIAAFGVYYRQHVDEIVESNIQTTMSTAPYVSNARLKRDSWSSQLTTLHLVATAFLGLKTERESLNLEIVTVKVETTHPPFLVMVETTVCAPGTSKSPITTLALKSSSIYRWTWESDWYDLPVLRESQCHLLADTVRASCVVFKFLVRTTRMCCGDRVSRTRKDDHLAFDAFRIDE